MSVVVRDETLVPRYLTPRDEPWIRLLVGEVDGFVGRPAALLDAELPQRVTALAFEHGVGPRTALGLTRVLARCWARRIDAPKPPAAIRRSAFEAAAQSERPDRAGALEIAASELHLSVPQVERSLYADLPERRL